MTVQAADGRLHDLTGEDLPYAIALKTGVSYRGAHSAEVLLSPRDAPGKPFLPDHSGWLDKRDAFFLVLGMFAIRLIVALADATAFALS